MKSNYHDRMMSARDPRFAKIADRLGYNRRDMQAAPTVDERVELRERYEKLVGKKPYMGWDAATLRQKIATAQDGK